MKKNTRAALSEIRLKSLPEGKEEWVVHTIGRVFSHERDHLVDVYLVRAGMDPRREADFLLRPVPVSLLPVLRIGSRWRGQCAVASRSKPSEKHTLQNIQPTAETLRNVEAADFHRDCFWLPRDVYSGGFHIRTNALRKTRNGTQPCRLLFPSPLVFASFYGTSSRLARLLTQTPRHQEITWERRLWLERMVEDNSIRSQFFPESKQLLICLSKLVDDGSARTVAWLFHEKEARGRAKQIANWISASSALGSTSTGTAHLRAALPFARPCNMIVEGKLNDDGEQLLVTSICSCDYQLEGVTELLIDRENDARHASMPSGVEYWPKTDHPGPRPKEATDPTGKALDEARQPDASQRASVWEVGSDFEPFPNLSKRKVPKRSSKNPPQAGDLPDDKADEELAIGTGAYLKDLPPPIEAELGPRPLDGSWAQCDEPGFEFIRRVLGHLGDMGWKVGFALGSSPIVPEDLRPVSKGKRQIGSKLLGAKLVRGSTGAFLFEFPHKEEPGQRSPACISTVLACPHGDFESPNDVVTAVFGSHSRVRGLGHLREKTPEWLRKPQHALLLRRLCERWRIRVLRHRWKLTAKASDRQAGTIRPDPAEKHASTIAKHIKARLAS